MSYVKKTWEAGQKVKSADLNNMEGGIDAAANPFIVTLTPTAQDFSGTMDKTVAEINTAYEAGRRIFFRVYTSAAEYVEVDCTMRGRLISAGDYPSFNGYIIDENNNLLIYAYTGVNASASKNTYSAKIYPLTPMT